MKPDADQILADANKLKTERFKNRDEQLKARSAERFNENVIDVPSAYKKTANQHKSNIIEDEGRNIGTLVYSMPVPHIPPPSPEDQPMTTTAEQFLMAWHEEAEAAFGPVWWQATLGQIHDDIAWIYCGWKRVPYKGQPEPPSDAADIADTLEYGIKNDRFKKNAGVKAFCDYRYVPTLTTLPVGSIYDPDRFYEIKEVPEIDLMRTYGITKNADGSYSKATEDPTTTPSGYAQGRSTSETLIKVVEYWDRDWCMIVAESNKAKWLNMRQVKSAFVLEEWEHGWGRTPYFARPAFVTDKIEEEKKFSGPLDGVYTEMPQHKRLRIMGDAVAYQTAFSPLQLESPADSSPSLLDDSGNKLVFLELVPGKAIVNPPGSRINTIPQSPEVKNLYAEMAASQQRIEHYSLSAVSKGISPGADTANSALSNLHRFQLSTLQPLADQAAKQAQAMYRFVLERIEDMGERVFVFDESKDSYLSLDETGIPSLNVQAKVTPDQGQFQLLIEKHAAELKQLGLITHQEMYEMWGKENPEQYVLELQAEQLYEMLKPVVMQQIVSDMGMLDATHAMMQANAQTGDARTAVPGLMGQIQGMNAPTGAGKGSAGAPRTEGVRSPAVQTTTQPTLGGG